MVLTKELFMKCMPPTNSEKQRNLYAKRIDRYLVPINEAMAEFKINTPERIAAFLAQTLHESECFRYSKEVYNGESYDVGRKAKSLGNTPEDDGDGEKYVGRGPIQITGTSNYAALTSAVGRKYGVDFIKNPELLEKPLYGCLGAGWFWSTRGLNELADSNEFEMITKRINGGLTHHEQRVEHWMRCKKAFNIL